MLPLQTERLTIRELVAGDLDELADIYADPKVRWWERRRSRETRHAAIDASLERYRRAGMGEYAVLLRAGGRLIGVGGPALREIEGDCLPELGWELRSDQWGHGCATEAAAGTLTHAVDLGLPRVYSLIVPDDVRSQGVTRRIGMTIQRQVTWSDRPHDLWARDLP
ncbi:MAG: GNAT family N-acetyltransferase [Actinobacteria bacterium]|nr:GNAT family N-acetyltransferase [Actinomycetota bacterium]